MNHRYLSDSELISKICEAKYDDEEVKHGKPIERKIDYMRIIPEEDFNRVYALHIRRLARVKLGLWPKKKTPEGEPPTKKDIERFEEALRDAGHIK